MSDWIEWKGGECPVPPDTRVQVRFVSDFWGTTHAEDAARKFSWARPSLNVYGFIAAYRVVSEEPKAETGVWIKWSGGERPVPHDTLVEVRYRGGKENVGVAARWDWDWDYGWNWRLHPDGPPTDIVEYRVVPQNPVPDMVNSPPHYTDGGIEAIDYIAAKLGPDGFKAYCVGNALKYISRAGKKGSAKEDLSKAIWYLRRAGGE